MDFKMTLIETLEARFLSDEDGRSEVSDICTHGINSCATDGFVWNDELVRFFDEFESEIEDTFYDIYGDTWIKDSGIAECDSFDGMKCHAVQAIVESWCCAQLDENE